MKIELRVVYPFYLRALLSIIVFIGTVVLYLIDAYEWLLLMFFQVETSEYSEQWLNVYLYQALYQTSKRLARFEEIPTEQGVLNEN